MNSTDIIIVSVSEGAKKLEPLTEQCLIRSRKKWDDGLRTADPHGHFKWLATRLTPDGVVPIEFLLSTYAGASILVLTTAATTIAVAADDLPEDVRVAVTKQHYRDPSHGYWAFAM